MNFISACEHGDFKEVKDYIESGKVTDIIKKVFVVTDGKGIQD